MKASQLPVPTDAMVNASIPLPENSIEYVRVLPLVVMERVTLAIVVSASKALWRSLLLAL